MKEIDFKYPKGSTPLDKNEINGLIPDYITTQEELNVLEKENIKSAVTWYTGKKHKDCLEIDFVFNLHQKMFGQVWEWAGTQRSSDKSIGIDWRQIIIQLKQLLENTKLWIKEETYSSKELAARFHHKLVQIHPFPNGNGRLARLMTDILMFNNSGLLPNWSLNKSNDTIDVEGKLRDEYINALREADNGKFEKLTNFMYF